MAENGAKLVSTYRDGTSTTFDATITFPAAVPGGTFLTTVFRKAANSGRLDAFVLIGQQIYAASITGGNGALAMSSLGMILAGNGETGFSSGSGVANANTGHNRPATFIVFRGYLADDQVRGYLQNPYQAWAYESSSLWMPMAASTGVDLAVAPGVSQPQGASVAITQTHQLVAAPGLSQVALGVGAVVQTHVVAVAAGISQPAAASVAVGQAHVLAVAAGSSQPGGAAVAVSQVHVLAAAPGTSKPVGPSVSIGTAGQLLAAPGVSQPVGASVAITQVHVLAVSPGTSTPNAPALAITQAHRLAVAPGSSLAMAGAVAIVQRHVLAAALGTSQPVGPAVSLVGATDFEASLWRTFRILAEDRVFKIAGEQRRFGVTDG